MVLPQVVVMVEPVVVQQILLFVEQLEVPLGMMLITLNLELLQQEVGGGAGDNGVAHNGGDGGGESGIAGLASGGSAGSSTSGYAFGYGGNGSSGDDTGGGGGGWYGGYGGITAERGGGGGSGYVYTSNTASNYPSGCLLNSSYYLTNAQTIAGNQSFTNVAGTGNETGHSGHGVAKITPVN